MKTIIYVGIILMVLIAAAFTWFIVTSKELILEHGETRLTAKR